jgi:hypothetical protein
MTLRLNLAILVIAVVAAAPMNAAPLASLGDVHATAEDFQALHYMSSPAKVQALRDSPKEMENSITEILSPRVYNSQVAMQLPLSAEEARYAAMQRERIPLTAALNIAERRARAAFRADDPLVLSRSRELWVADETAYLNDETADFTQIFFDAGRRSFAEINDRVTSAKAELAGGANFDDVLQKYTDDKAVSQSKGQMKGMVITRIDALIGRLIFKQLKVGEISDAFPSRAGIHSIRLDRKSPREKKPYQDVQRQILEKMLEDTARLARAKVLDDLKLGQVKFSEDLFGTSSADSNAERQEKIRAIHKEMGIPINAQPTAASPPAQ